MIWRAMTETDLDAVEAAAAVIHPGYPEDRGVFAERLALWPEGCRVLERAGGLVGYAITHPGVYGRPPKLNTLLGTLAPNADTYYFHDIALLPGVRGRGGARVLVADLASLAERLGFATLSLVAVNASRPIWEAQGFDVATDATPDLGSYGGEAWFMVRQITDTF
jgi:GNAT superfamily N-acetyltransferase